MPQMVQKNEDAKCTAFTVSVDKRHGITTGISATDRAATFRGNYEPVHVCMCAILSKYSWWSCISIDCHACSPHLSSFLGGWKKLCTQMFVVQQFWPPCQVIHKIRFRHWNGTWLWHDIQSFVLSFFKLDNTGSSRCMFVCIWIPRFPQQTSKILHACTHPL